MYEIQLHPADIRRQVRYYFLSRRAMAWLRLAGLVFALLLVAGAVLAPIGVQSLLLGGRLRVLAQQNRTQREVLDQREAALDRLQRQTDEARNRQRQMSLILGAPQTAHSGAGTPSPQPVRELLVADAEIAVRRSLKLDTDTLALLTLSDELASFARANEELTRAVPSICPLPVGSFVLTSPFGNRTSPFTNTIDFHAGIDLAAREGTPVLAPGDGRVVFAGRFPLNRNVSWWRYGNVVVLRHSERYISIFAHLQDISVLRGSQLVRGEPLGTVGNTGWSTSPHLHYEVRVTEDEESEPQPVDPRIFILNYRWTGYEDLLVVGRTAPAPTFDPLPSRVWRN
ncbi:MAG: M23 family metallopeptidase [Thermoanaerobaculales bacterium]|jgi:murein DD-endopeptidase MepM/ murein hydrolase activator NlpD|nr:M23 family metallopeptidase [Thermoanaerobaculales bacterium]